MRRIFRENWSFFFRYQRSKHKEFLFADRFDGEPECKYYESDRSCRGYWRYDLQKQGMELRALRNPEHEYIRILGVSTCIAELQSVYQDELFFKVKKKSSLDTCVPLPQKIQSWSVEILCCLFILDKHMKKVFFSLIRSKLLDKKKFWVIKSRGSELRALHDALQLNHRDSKMS